METTRTEWGARLSASLGGSQYECLESVQAVDELRVPIVELLRLDTANRSTVTFIP